MNLELNAEDEVEAHVWLHNMDMDAVREKTAEAWDDVK